MCKRKPSLTTLQFNKQIYISVFSFLGSERNWSSTCCSIPSCVFSDLYFCHFFFRQRERDRLLSLSSLFVVKENWIERVYGVPDGSGTFWVARTVFYVYLCIHRESPLPPFTPWGKKKKMAKMSPQHNIPGLANMLARQYSTVFCYGGQ